MNTTYRDFTFPALSIIACVIGSLLTVLGCAPANDADVDDAASAAATSTMQPAPGAFVNIDVPVSEPSQDETVTLGMAVDASTAAPGDRRTVGVKLRVADGWHTYAVDKPTGVNKPTELSLQLPAGWQAVGGWSIPEPHSSDGETFSYEDEVLFRRQIEIPSDVDPGTYSLTCEVKYQSCSDSMCLRPTQATLTADLTVAANE